MNKTSPLSFILLASFLTFSCVGPQVHSLTCETLANPLGIDNTSPHFSWKVAGELDSACAYRIQVASSLSNLKSGKADFWDSGIVESSNSVMVPYAGKALKLSLDLVFLVRAIKPADDDRCAHADARSAEDHDRHNWIRSADCRKTILADEFTDND